MLHKTLQDDDIDLTAAYIDHKARMINVALDHCCVYTRWQTVITTMIEKIPGVPCLDKLRVIHIIESDFNLWMGIVCGQQMIFQEESVNLLGDEQSGSRPGKMCQDVVIFKHMWYSVLRLARSDGITFNNDAKSCFDRIVLSAASLVLQRLGLSGEVMELFIKTLSKVGYFAKTYYGLSTMPYKETKAHGIHGPGQGGRASPAISCILLQCMRENSVGANITSPQGHQQQQVSSGFVDDITHWCIMMNNQNSLDESTEQTLMHHMQEMAQLWEQFLKFTGEKIELSKFFYYPIVWKFDSEGAAFLKLPNELPSTISLQDSESKQLFHISSKPCDEAHKTLGVMEQQDGQNTAEVHRLIKKSLSHAQIIAGSILKYKETETYYFAIYVPSMSYSCEETEFPGSR
jgi:Reverse transcriptase (RNA-dependent DNA polymerase)